MAPRVLTDEQRKRIKFMGMDTYKKYLREFIGKSGDLDENRESGVFEFLYGLTEDTPAEIKMVGDDYIVLNVTPKHGSHYVITIPLARFILKNPC